MDVGDLHLAEVPYRGGSGGKRRIVLIVKQLSSTEVLVVESRGTEHPQLDLIGIVDFSRRGYVGLPYSGRSHFYLQNLRVLDPACVVPEPVGGLTPSDFRLFFAKIDGALRSLGF